MHRKVRAKDKGTLQYDLYFIGDFNASVVHESFPQPASLSSPGELIEVCPPGTEIADDSSKRNIADYVILESNLSIYRTHRLIRPYEYSPHFQ